MPLQSPARGSLTTQLPEAGEAAVAQAAPGQGTQETWQPPSASPSARVRPGQERGTSHPSPGRILGLSHSSANPPTAAVHPSATSLGNFPAPRHHLTVSVLPRKVHASPSPSNASCSGKQPPLHSASSSPCWRYRNTARARTNFPPGSAHTKNQTEESGRAAGARASGCVSSGEAAGSSLPPLGRVLSCLGPRQEKTLLLLLLVVVKVPLPPVLPRCPLRRLGDVLLVPPATSSCPFKPRAAASVNRVPALPGPEAGGDPPAAPPWLTAPFLLVQRDGLGPRQELLPSPSSKTKGQAR